MERKNKEDQASEYFKWVLQEIFYYSPFEIIWGLEGLYKWVLRSFFYNEVNTIRCHSNYDSLFFTDMNYSNMDLENLIDTSCIQDLLHTYPRTISTFPSLTMDSAPLNEPIEVFPPSMMSSMPNSSSLPLELRLLRRERLLKTQLPKSRLWI